MQGLLIILTDHMPSSDCEVIIAPHRWLIVENLNLIQHPAAPGRRRPAPPALPTARSAPSRTSPKDWFDGWNFTIEVSSRRKDLRAVLELMRGSPKRTLRTIPGWWFSVRARDPEGWGG